MITFLWINWCANDIHNTHSSMLKDCHAGVFRTFHWWHFGIEHTTLFTRSVDICISFRRDHCWRKLAAKFVRTIWFSRMNSSLFDDGDFRSQIDCCVKINFCLSPIMSKRCSANRNWLRNIPLLIIYCVFWSHCFFVVSFHA